ncbi:MAG: OsmC family protein [Caldilineaceae bacterium]|nr:OsmC family protein [Caldilineaceae bacterium]
MAKLDPYLTRKAGVLAQRRLDFTDAPEAALVQLKATAHCAGNTGVRPTKMGDYIIVSDSAPGLAGHSLGPSSPEMLLGALASCLVHTYLLQATLLNIPLDSVEVEITGALDMTGVVGLETDAPSMLQNLAYHAQIESPATADVVESLHVTVDQTCAVLNTLRNPMTVTRQGAVASQASEPVLEAVLSQEPDVDQE